MINKFRHKNQNFSQGISKPYYEKIEEYFEAITNDSDVKVIEFDASFNEQNQIILYDIQIAAKGHMEDKKYALRSYLLNNVRRGNTLIQIKTQDNKQVFRIGRKGLKKFFDVKIEDIYQHITTGKINQNNDKEDQNIMLQIFEEAEQCLQEGHKIELVNTVKANGVNCQITYIKEVNAWMISSKNVSLLARDIDDVQLYKNQQTYSKNRFEFAIVIAEEWFNILARLKSHIKYQQFLETLDRFTLIGEYCGNQNYQHLIKYTKIDIYFYAMVDKEDQYHTCQDIQKSYAFFEDYFLSKVNFESLGCFTSFKDLNLAILNVFKKVSEAFIDDYEEGSVLYIIKQAKNMNEKEVLSLCKLKTLEYRIYRKLREKLRHFQMQRDNSPHLIIQKFRNETKNLCKEFYPPKPSSYYTNVAQVAFKFICDYNKKETQILFDQYISFMSVVLECQSQGKIVQPQMFSQNNIDRVMQIPWKTYSSSQVQVIEKQTLDKFTFQMIVLVPIGIPGMGKTFFKKEIEQQVNELQATFLTISSDEIRSNLMNSIIQKKGINEEQAYNQTKNSALQEFKKQLRLLFEEGLHLQSNLVIFIDKNHPPNAIKGALQDIQEYYSNYNQYHSLTKVAITPITFSELQFDDRQYPFSINFLMNCMDRIIKRGQTHQTLKGSKQKVVDVLLMFFNLFKNISLSDQSLNKQGFDEVKRLPFVYEDIKSSSLFEKEVIDLLIKNIKLQENQKNNFEYQKSLNQLIEYVENSEFNFKTIELKQIQSCVYQMLINLLITDNDKNNTQNKKEVQILFEEQKQEVIRPFNQNKIPLYLGVFAINEAKCEKQIVNYIRNGIQLYLDNLSTSNELHQLLANELQTFEGNYQFSKDGLHLTTLFIGHNSSQTKNLIYSNFTQNQLINIPIFNFIIIPNKLIVSSVKVEGLKVDNEFPHITLMTNDWAPKFSNDVLSQLFSCDKIWSKYYEDPDILHSDKTKIIIDNCLEEFSFQENQVKNKKVKKNDQKNFKNSITIEGITGFR